MDVDAWYTVRSSKDRHEVTADIQDEATRKGWEMRLYDGRDGAIVEGASVLLHQWMSDSMADIVTLVPSGRGVSDFGFKLDPIPIVVYDDEQRTKIATLGSDLLKSYYKPEEFSRIDRAWQDIKNIIDYAANM